MGSSPPSIHSNRWILGDSSLRAKFRWWDAHPDLDTVKTFGIFPSERWWSSPIHKGEFCHSLGSPIHYSWMTIDIIDSIPFDLAVVHLLVGYLYHKLIIFPSTPPARTAINHLIFCRILHQFLAFFGLHSARQWAMKLIQSIKQKIGEDRTSRHESFMAWEPWDCHDSQKSGSETWTFLHIFSIKTWLGKWMITYMPI